MQAEIKIFQDIDSLESIAEAWDMLAIETAQASPLMTHAWLSCFFNVYAGADNWFVVVAFVNGELVAVLPLIIKSGAGLWKNKSVLQLPGNNQTLSVDAVVKAGMESLLPQLHRAAFKHWPDAYCLNYSRIDQISGNLRYLQRNRGLFCQSDLAGYGYGLALQQTFDEYFASLSKNQKSNIKRWSNKLVESLNVEFEYDRNFNQENLKKIFELENSGWKGREGTSVLGDRQAAKFFSLLAESLAAKGWLVLQLLKLDGELIAGNFSIQFKNTVLIWKLAYSEQHAKMSPGSLLLLDVIKKSIHEKLAGVDLMTSEKWYENWNMQRRPFVDIYLFNTRSISGIAGALAKWTRLILSGLKQRVRRITK